jgi:hypothetical protein
MTAFLAGILTGAGLMLGTVLIGLAVYAVWTHEDPPYGGGPEL